MSDYIVPILRIWPKNKNRNAELTKRKRKMENLKVKMAWVFLIISTLFMTGLVGGYIAASIMEDNYVPLIMVVSLIGFGLLLAVALWVWVTIAKDLIEKMGWRK